MRHKLLPTTGSDTIATVAAWLLLERKKNLTHCPELLDHYKTRTDDEGKERKIYRYEIMMTPYDKLKSLPNAKDYLKLGLSFEILDKIAYRISDNQAADQLQKARRKLFKTIHGRVLSTS